MTKKLFFMMVLAFGYNVSLYSCEGYKSGDEPEIVDLTPDFELAPVSGKVLSVEPYAGVSCWKEVISADGIRKFSAYHVIDKDSLAFKARERAVEDFALQARNNYEKLKYYAGATCSGGMSPRYIASSWNRAATYCLIHRCYEHECLRLYALQAYVVQPADIKIEEGSVDEAIQKAGRLAVMEKFASQFTTTAEADSFSVSQSASKNAVRGLLHRSLGVKPGMKLPAKS